MFFKTLLVLNCYRFERAEENNLFSKYTLILIEQNITMNLMALASCPKKGD